MSETVRHDSPIEKYTLLSRQIWNHPFLAMASVLILAGLLTVTLDIAFKSSVFVDEPLHAALEASGAVIALILAPLFLVLKYRAEEKERCFWACSSLIAIGILDLAHALSPAGPTFYLTRSLGNFVGGVLMAMVWLTHFSHRPKHLGRIPLATFLIVTPLTLLFYLIPNEWLLSHVSTRDIDLTIAILNDLGVLGFLAAAAYFFVQVSNGDFGSNKALAKASLLLAFAGLLFSLDQRWSSTWWLFHFLRFFAFLTLLNFIRVAFKASLRTATQLNLSLETEVTKRTQQLAAANQHLKNEIQERCKSASELQQIRGQLEATLQSMSDGVSVFDKNGKLIFSNRAQAEIYQGISATALNKPLAYFSDRYEMRDLKNRLVPIDEWPISRALLGEKISNCVFKVRDKERNIEWYLELSGQPVIDDRKQTVLAVIVTRDITAFKKAEIQLKENEARLRKIADCMPQIIWTADAQGKPNYFNLKWFEYTGQKVSGDPHQVDWISPIHPEDQPNVAQKWRYSLETSESFQFELRLKRFDGQYRWHLARALLLKNSGDEGVSWFGTSTDIHDQKELLNRIRDSEAHFNIATAAAEIGTWNVDLTLRKITSSPINNQIMGFDSERTVEDPSLFREKVHPEDLDSLKACFQRAIANKTDFICEHRILKSENEVRWIYTRGRAVYDHDGRPIRLYGINIDMTDRKNIEEKLKIALHKANEANKLKSAFLANMSHEIRTPLGAILGFTDLLRENDLTHEERNHFFEVINRNGEQLSALINDILDLSKVESGQFKVEIIQSDLRKIVHEVIALHEINAQRKNLQLTCVIEDNVPQFIGTDPIRLKQIITNIVGNSLKFTQSGFIQVHVLTDSENLIRIQIQDSGIGLTSEQRQNLFQPFSQADCSTTRKYGGTGLGLVLSRKLAKALGGDLTILTSKPGVGSIFEIKVADQKVSDTFEKPEQKAFEASVISAERHH